MAQLLNAASGDPFTYKEAMESDSAQDWVDACQYEMDALDKLKVWCLEPLPEGRKAVKSKWVFKKKADVLRSHWMSTATCNDLLVYASVRLTS